MIHYLTDEEFYGIYGKVPRLNIDLVIKSPEGILLALRTIEPHQGCWHLPGGTVYKGELLADAAARIAKKETGLDISIKKDMGYMEFPAEIRNGIAIHTVSVVFEVEPAKGELRHDEHAKELRYFKELPEMVIPIHEEFLRQKGYY